MSSLKVVSWSLLKFSTFLTSSGLSINACDNATQLVYTALQGASFSAHKSGCVCQETSQHKELHALSSVSAHPVLVYNVGDNVQLAIVFAIVDDDDPSHLNIPLERHSEGLIPLPSDPKCSKGLRRRIHMRLCSVEQHLDSTHVHGSRVRMAYDIPHFGL